MTTDPNDPDLYAVATAYREARIAGETDHAAYRAAVAAIAPGAHGSPTPGPTVARSRDRRLAPSGERRGTPPRAGSPTRAYSRKCPGHVTFPPHGNQPFANDF